MAARVCERHMQYCQDGKCPWCEPVPEAKIVAPPPTPVPLPEARLPPGPTCPHYGLRHPSVYFGDIKRASFDTHIQIAIIRPEDCPKCGLERIAKLREALNTMVAVASRMLHMPSSLPRERSLAEIQTAYKTLLDDMSEWWRP